MEPRWRAEPPDRLTIVCPLDALTLIFHRASGITHVVDTPVPELLEVLGDEALGTAELLDRLAARFDMPDGDPAALAARLDELAAAGLVARV